MVSLTTNNTNVSQSIDNNKFVFDFGTLKKGTKTQLDVLLKANGIKELSTKSTCGCTVATPEKVNDNLYKVDISYNDYNIAKPFSKTVKIMFKSGSTDHTILVNIKGNITN